MLLGFILVVDLLDLRGKRAALRRMDVEEPFQFERTRKEEMVTRPFVTSLVIKVACLASLAQRRPLPPSLRLIDTKGNLYGKLC